MADSGGAAGIEFGRAHTPPPQYRVDSATHFRARFVSEPASREKVVVAGVSVADPCDDRKVDCPGVEFLGGGRSADPA